MSQHLIRLSKSCLSQIERQEVMDVLEREFLGMGAETQRFESELERYIGRKTVCVANGTAALHLALQACGIGPRDEVLVQSLTYVASFQAISATGAKPVACDVDPITMTLDWRDAERRITSRTKAVMPVHYSGGAGDLNAICDFAEIHKLRIIEDAAHAFGTIYEGHRVGSFGDIACFSFDGIKNITSGEGGALVSDDPRLIDKVQDARLLGVKRDSERRYAGERSWEFDVTVQGWRYHMSNIMAAIGLVQLHRFPEMAKRRQHLASLYDSRLIDNASISIIPHDYSKVVPHIYVVRITGIKDRKALQSHLLERRIQTGVHYAPNHSLTFYRDTSARPLPITDALYPELLTLPLHPDLSEEDIHYVCDQLFDTLD